MELRFLGAAATVTGSQYLLTTKKAKVLIDCGMFQGSPNEGLHNRTPPEYDPSSINALLLTHAHLDHCGLIPLLCKRGFTGPIYATAGTVELAGIVLLDSGKLQEEFAKRGASRADRKDHGAADDEEAPTGVPSVRTDVASPLYTAAEAESSLRSFKPIGYGKEFPVAEGVRATFYDAGHILGSASIRVVANDGDGTPDRVIVFSGDIGRPGSPIVRDPTPMSDADYVLIESTYGGREHDPFKESVDALAQIVRLVAKHNGVLLVPSFAIGRTQEIVYELDRLLEAKQIPHLPLYLDSPMASKATDIYRRHREYFDEPARTLLDSGDDPIDYPGATVTNDANDSKAIKTAPRPYMIVASNGMLTGGRVLHHLRNLIDDPTATLLFVGYQGEGTLGWSLQNGATEVRIDGQPRQVRCRVRSISGFSAHADESELLDWIGSFSRGARKPKKVYIVHGDPPAEAALEPKLRALGYDTRVPVWNEVVTLS